MGKQKIYIKLNFSFFIWFEKKTLGGCQTPQKNPPAHLWAQRLWRRDDVCCSTCSPCWLGNQWRVEALKTETWHRAPPHSQYRTSSVKKWNWTTDEVNWKLKKEKKEAVPRYQKVRKTIIEEKSMSKQISEKRKPDFQMEMLAWKSCSIKTPSRTSKKEKKAQNLAKMEIRR